MTKVEDTELVIQLVSVATTQPAEAAGVILMVAFSGLGLIAVFSESTLGQIPQAAQTSIVLIIRCRNVRLVSMSAIAAYGPKGDFLNGLTAFLLCTVSENGQLKEPFVRG